MLSRLAICCDIPAVGAFCPMTKPGADSRRPVDAISPGALPVGSVPARRVHVRADARSDDADPRLRSITALTGYHIHATDGAVGHVDDFLGEDAEWNITSLKHYGKRVYRRRAGDVREAMSNTACTFRYPAMRRSRKLPAA